MHTVEIWRKEGRTASKGVFFNGRSPWTVAFISQRADVKISPELNRSWGINTVV